VEKFCSLIRNKKLKKLCVIINVCVRVCVPRWTYLYLCMNYISYTTPVLLHTHKLNPTITCSDDDMQSIASNMSYSKLSIIGILEDDVSMSSRSRGGSMDERKWVVYHHHHSFRCCVLCSSCSSNSSRPVTPVVSMYTLQAIILQLIQIYRVTCHFKLVASISCRPLFCKGTFSKCAID